MKNTIYTLITLFLLTACCSSNDDDKNTDLDNKHFLISSINYTESENDKVVFGKESEFKYDDNNKLISIISKEMDDPNSYEDNTSIQPNESDDPNDYVFELIDEYGDLGKYHMVDNKLVKFISDNEEEYTYEYNDKNQLIKLVNTYDKYTNTEKYTWRNNNLVEIYDVEDNSVANLYYYENVNMTSNFNPDLYIIYYYTGIEHKFELPITGVNNKNLLRKYEYVRDGITEMKVDILDHELDDKNRVISSDLRRLDIVKNETKNETFLHYEINYLYK